MTIVKGFREDFKRIMRGQYTGIASIPFEDLTEIIYTKILRCSCFKYFRMTTPF